MWKPFEKYISVSIVNTLFHWISFSFFVYALACSQSFDNLLAFLIAVSFGFIANARWAFKNEATKKRYFLFLWGYWHG
ncbi:GtrA family protein [Erwinia sp. 198]|uniref:GtrA family protein n=1 Tax=Erwinia sp. 198 TaxID=2022746 RepID=UPI000F68955C|nr:GtrA family protein [Erwinia sp. 198]RRZ94528.1 hypothetical protein EGK14_05700 [Erwinia sp. 198]